ncbi:MAG: dinucleotide-binding enzyme, partial [Gammaproteobacteria bacterium]|nr:dinucleotide-binding enzyme [Gammaproteobacteria bacterium]
ELVARTTGKAAATTQAAAASLADIVLLAIPWTATETVVKELGDLTGKIVIDPTNPYQRTAAGLAEHTVTTSAGEMIQGWLPQARVVKAFNTLSSLTMADPASAGGPVTIPLVGNDAEAKAVVAKLVESIGLEAIDLGPIQYAHEVEGMLIVWANARLSAKPFDYYLRRTTPAN